MAHKTPETEFSRPFAVDRLGATPASETVQAKPAECAALAKRFGIVSLGQLSASVRIERVPGGLVRVSGRLEADVVQTCVVSLVNFPTHIEESFSADFGDAPPVAGEDIELDVDYDAPEPIEGGVIDLGEVVAQYLSLALDPHPRAPGAALDPAWSEADEVERSPFAILKTLKTKN